MNRRFFLKLALSAPLVSTFANYTEAKTKSEKFMITGFRVPAPMGWRKLADSVKQRTAKSEKHILNLNSDALLQLKEVNLTTNKTVKYRADSGSDIWSIATDEGDCEDIALKKIHELTSIHGFPRSCFSITTCKTEQSIGHAVLIVHTTHGDFVLDNRFNDIRLWSNTPYKWISTEHHGSSSWLMILNG